LKVTCFWAEAKCSSSPPSIQFWRWWVVDPGQTSQWEICVLHHNGNMYC